MKKSNVFLVMMITFAACKAPYQNEPFSTSKVPTPPDYALADSWAVLPGAYPEALKNILGEVRPQSTDVFYVYPTLLSDRKDSSWNADIWADEIRENVLNSAVKYQASAWAAAANIYVPFYRQAHYRIFVEPFKSQGGPAWEIAYDDVKRAFQYYLDYYNQGKPIIIASHSQGSMHAKRLIEDFFDNKPLQKQLVAAYLVGTRIPQDTFKSIRPMVHPDAIGGFVSWNSYKQNKFPKAYETYFKNSVSTNPITWDTRDTTTYDEHKGVMYTDGQLYPQSLTIDRIDGLVWVSLPKIPKRFLLRFIKNYHYADINLFWADISANAQLRAARWHALNTLD